MPTNNMSIVIGGEAGQGVETGGAGFARALARGGLFVYGLTDYMSRIRGGYNFFQVRVGERPVRARTDPVHLVLAFNDEAVYAHLDGLVEGSAVIYDDRLEIDTGRLAARHVQPFPTPLAKIAKEMGGSDIMLNTAALAATVGVTDYDFERVAGVVEQNFRRKGQAVVDTNLKVAEAAYQFARETYARDYGWKLSPVPALPRMLINGNHAFAMGAVASGCRFISGYPMTPATSILEWMIAQADRFGIVTKQTEDEIAAVLMAIGASHAGARAMTATSGGGFSLMVEAIGLAGMSETPLVVVLAQRGGPSTGLPTRTEQSDLEFALHASQGEFPRIVLAPGDVKQAFEAGARAFNLAEKYQMPVVVMTDLLLATQLETVDLDDLDVASVRIDRGETYTPDQVDVSPDGLFQPDGYHRYRLTDSGVSPRVVPGHPSAVYVPTGDEHTVDGRITEDSEIRNQQMAKRMGKLEAAAREVLPPELYGPEQAEVTFVAWGSTVGAVREAVDRLNEAGASANCVQFVDLWPFPAERAAELLGQARLTVAVEQNYTGQLATLIREQTGIKVDRRINKYDGRPLSAEEIVAALHQDAAKEVALNV